MCSSRPLSACERVQRLLTSLPLPGLFPLLGPAEQSKRELPGDVTFPSCLLPCSRCRPKWERSLLISARHPTPDTSHVIQRKSLWVARLWMVGTVGCAPDTYPT